MTDCWARPSVRRRFPWCAPMRPSSIPTRKLSGFRSTCCRRRLGLAGFANLTSDSDDFVRRQELIEAPPWNRRISLALCASRRSTLGATPNGRRASWFFKATSIPIAADRSIAINYAGPPGTFPSVSLADFENAAKAGNMDQLRKWVNGKIVLVGTDCTGGPPRHAVFHALQRDQLADTRAWRSMPTRCARCSRRITWCPRRNGRWCWRCCWPPRWPCGSSPRSRPAGRSALVLLEMAAILVATHLLFERGLHPVHVRSSAGHLVGPGRIAGLSLGHRGNARQSVSPRGVAVRGQTAGLVARRIRGHRAYRASAWK